MSEIDYPCQEHSAKPRPTYGTKDQAIAALERWYASTGMNTQKAKKAAKDAIQPKQCPGCEMWFNQ